MIYWYIVFTQQITVSHPLSHMERETTLEKDNGAVKLDSMRHRDPFEFFFEM